MSGLIEQNLCKDIEMIKQNRKILVFYLFCCYVWLQMIFSQCCYYFAFNIKWGVAGNNPMLYHKSAPLLKSKTNKMRNLNNMTGWGWGDEDAIVPEVSNTHVCLMENVFGYFFYLFIYFQYCTGIWVIWSSWITRALGFVCEPISMILIRQST